MRGGARIGAATAALLSLASGALAEEPSAPREGAPAYVGDASCGACHGGLLEPYEHTTHASVFTPGNARSARMERGCEACHGPAGAHVAAGGESFEGMLRFDEDEPAAEQNAVCLQCHRGGEQVYWSGSAHDAADLACGACHVVMKRVSASDLLSRETQTETCAACHLLPRSQGFRNAHMPVREGVMDCGSCHNPHGTVADNLVAAQTVNDNCYSCHAEKRGPFLWEHPPVYEDCLNCHDPHGTTREAMLKLSQPRLCQQCHVSGHGGAPRAPDHRFVVGRSCLNCHTNVHGSNHPSGSGLTR